MGNGAKPITAVGALVLSLCAGLLVASEQVADSVNTGTRHGAVREVVRALRARGCGGIDRIPCRLGEGCELAEGMCNVPDLKGVCAPPPQDCATDVTPVCGCDGITYTNDCARRAAQVARDHQRPCATPESIQVDALMAVAGIAADSPGGAAVVIHDGRILHSAGYGLADVARRAKNTPRTIFRLASITKSFTALAIMMLAEEGMLGYDDPLAMYLPELARFGQGVTIRRVLSHTGGFADYINDVALSPHLLRRTLEPLAADELTLLAERGKLMSIPGERFIYSNTGYDMLALVIERLSGQTYGDFLEERVFRPLGMRATFSLPNAAGLADPERARGYRVLENRAELSDSTPFDNLAGAASIYSTLEDLYRYDQALYSDVLVDQATLAQAFTPGRLSDGSEVPFGLSPDPDDLYGFGCELGTHRDERYVGNGGVWKGYRAYFLRFVDRRVTVVLLLNRADIAFRKLVFDIADVYLPSPGE